MVLNKIYVDEHQKFEQWVMNRILQFLLHQVDHNVIIVKIELKTWAASFAFNVDCLLCLYVIFKQLVFTGFCGGYIVHNEDK